MDQDLTLSFDPATDVVRVRMGYALDDCVAVPLEDLTILLSGNADAVVGIDIEDLPTFVRRYVPDEAIPAVTGYELFKLSERHLAPLMSLFIRNLGPTAKDKVAQWDAIVEQAIEARQRRQLEEGL